MALIDLFFERAFKRGTLSVTYADGTTKSFGTADPDYPDVAIRFTSKGVPGQIVRNPALGVAEAFMHGRMVIERGDLMQLLTLATKNNRWEDATGALDPGLVAKAVVGVKRTLD